MSGKLSSLSRRLAKVEQQRANRARRAKLFNCICRDETIVTSDRPQNFAAEMDLPCPSHGFRRLGRIKRFTRVNPDGTAKPHPVLDRLIATYKARLHQANREVTHSPQES
jgi:hypothetical protein